MSDYLAGLRKVAEAATRQRAAMSDAERAHYSPPPDGAFVGTHTGFVVVPDRTVLLALLAVVEAAEGIASDDYLEQPGPYATGIRREEAVALTEAVVRLRTLTGEDQT